MQWEGGGGWRNRTAAVNGRIVLSNHALVNAIFEAPKLDDRQITHLICVRLRHLLYDFLRGCFGPFM